MSRIRITMLALTEPPFQTDGGFPSSAVCAGHDQSLHKTSQKCHVSKRMLGERFDVDEPKDANDAEKALLMVLASNLLASRIARGWTQEELGNRSGLGKAYIYRTEKAANNLTIGSLTSIATALGESVSRLLSSDCSDEQAQPRKAPAHKTPPVGSHFPPRAGTLAIEVPESKAFDIARSAATTLGYSIPLIDPTTRLISGIAAAIPKRQDISDS